MGFPLSHYCCFLCVIVLLPVLCKCEDAFTYSRATYYGTPDGLGTPTGACGFGEYGRSVNGGNVGAVSRLYRDGTGCGACYQVRCKMPNLCADVGMKVVVTDHGGGDDTDFILSRRGFSMLARPNKAADLFAYGVVGIEYRRVPCQYPGSNIFFKVHENSRFPDYLALVMLYQAGLSDITAVDIWQEDSQAWKGMRKSHGAVWDMPNPPKGPVSLRFQVSGRRGQKWVQLMNVIPSDWKAGVAYDSNFQLDY
ncbi:expansin-like B1 [Vitis vinifera]|uniref:Expansin-like B1 n=2 Tax=Vitis vinifera TaxID=29760 RepID=A0A438K2C0_VITVI|eukprot:XP_002270175.2 PREDICTED: expansin-like B1 [Vitis vinifera]